MRASCSPTAAASSCRGATPRRSRTEIIGLLDDPDEARRAAASAPPRTGAACAGRPSRGAIVDSFERARAEHARPPAHGVPRRRRSRRVRPSCREVNLEHVAVMTDDTGMLQHATFDVPRYDDGYCLDDNARALLLMTHLEEAGTEAPKVVRALASRYLAFVSHAFNATTGRFRNFMSYSRDLARGAGLRGQPRSRAVGARARSSAARPIPGGTSLGRRALPRRAARGVDASRARARGPTRCSASTSTCARSRATAACRRAGSASPNAARPASAATDAPDWPWFEDRAHLLQRAPAAGAASCPASWIGDADDDRDRPALARVARSTMQRSPDGYFAPVGTNGFYDARHDRGGLRSAARRGLRDGLRVPRRAPA